ncbi:MAG: 6-carboxytetrahydropterin synthase [Chlorobi bacterium]|nr:6-carboxytetrahydropterin synthase [Chlorobiota bacterium]
MIYLTRRERFNAAHRLFRADWSDEMNLKVFGKCSNPNWHGHNYVLFVTVKGEIKPKTGFVVNLKSLSALIKKEAIDKMDHKNLNLEVEFIKGKIASAENIAVAIWGVLEKPIQELGAGLHCVKIVETENNFVEYFGK